MKKVIKGVAFRIITFYVLAIIVLGMVLPWQEAGVDESPFAKVFAIAGIPYARELMNFVVLTSALSAANSAIYACSRFLWSMSVDKQAPKFLNSLNRGGVPGRAILFTIFMSIVLVLLGEVTNDTGDGNMAAKLYLWLVNSSGLVGCMIWIIIALCQLRFRKLFLFRGGDLKDLKFKAPWIPFLPILVMLINGSLMFTTMFSDSERPLLITILLLTCLGYFGYQYFGPKEDKQSGV